MLADTVIKTEKLPVSATFPLAELYVNLLTFPSDVQFDYSRTDATYKNRACSKVTIKYHADDRTIALLNKMPLDKFQKLSEKWKDYLKQKTYVAVELLIGHEKSFIYNYKCYNVHGKNILAVDFGIPESMTFDASFFKIPDASIKTAATREEFNQIAKKSYSKYGLAFAAARILQSIGAFFESFWIFLLQYGSYIALVIAILAMASAVFLRIKGRQV